jgi:hypothetical protein
MAAPAARPSPEDRIRAALWFAERGFGVFTVWSTDAAGRCRCPKGRDCDNAGKHPVTQHGFQDATTDEKRIRTLLSAGSEPNYGLVCPEGVFTLDVDGDGVAHLAELERRLGPLPPTLRTRTANGEHVFLRWPAGSPRPIGQLWGFVTRWGSGQGAGYVIGPRSVHATGAVYTPGSVFEISELPESWAHDVLAPTPATSTDVIEIHGGYELPPVGYTGSRYEAIRDYIASRYKRGVTRDEILAGVLTVLAPRFADPLSDADLRSRFERAWKGTPERLGPPGPPDAAPRRALGPGMDAADLLALDLQPLRWIVPDLIPEGTTILAAPPKVGKSCLIYQVAVEAAIGGELLGRRVTPGSVLYLALEDGKRRGRDRLLVALAGRTMPHGRLEVRWDANRIGAGLEDDIRVWLDEHPDAAMVAVDTLGKVRPRSTGKQGAYEVDVQDLAALQDLFRDRPVALVIVHHARKEASDDFLATVSGTYGITGSADTILALRRKRLERFGTVYTTGRDIADAEVPVQFVDGRWLPAPAALPDASFQRSEVYEVIERRGPIFPKAIADELGLIRQSVQAMVGKLVESGAVAQTAKGYVVAGVTIAPSTNDQIALNTPRFSSFSSSNQSNRGEVSRAPARTHAREGAPAREGPALRVIPTDPTGWLNTCNRYRDHQSRHRQTPSGWTCDACHPEEGPA